MDAHIDVAAMHAGVPHTSDDVMADNGTGTVFLVDDFRRVCVEDSAVDEFDSGDSNAVLCRNVWKNKDCALIHFWQGRAATVPNKGSSAALTKEICVVHDKEPRHFLAVFADRFIVHDGRDPRATAVAQQANKEQEKEGLFQVAGSDAVHTHAVEKMHAAAELLNPNSVFVVVDCVRHRGFVCGCAGGQTSTRSTQKALAHTRSSTLAWSLRAWPRAASRQSCGRCSALTAHTVPRQGLCSSRVVPRLFVCSVASGAFNVDEVAQFSQNDLDAEDAVILDAHSTVFVWIGASSHPAEQKLSMDTAADCCCERSQVRPPAAHAVCRACVWCSSRSPSRSPQTSTAGRTIHRLKQRRTAPGARTERKQHRHSAAMTSRDQRGGLADPAVRGGDLPDTVCGHAADLPGQQGRHQQRRGPRDPAADAGAVGLKSCVGIFDTVSGDHAPLLNVTKCPKCGSDDLDIRKKKGNATCLACGKTISLQQLSKDGLIAKTLDVLPALAREAFIAAQTSSCRHKDRRAKDTIRQHNNEAATVRIAKGLLKCIIARMVVRLSVLWDLRENGKTLSAEIAQDLHRCEFSFREKMLLFLRQSSGERDHTTAMGIHWNRCLRKIFISVFFNTVVATFSGTAAAPAADDAMDYWREMVQRCFVDMNELEQVAVEKWLAHNSLDTLLAREMPESGDTGVPTQPVPRGRSRGRRVHRHKHAAQQPHHPALRVPRGCGLVSRSHRHRRPRTARQQTQQQ